VLADLVFEKVWIGKPDMTSHTSHGIQVAAAVTSVCSADSVAAMARLSRGR
jgi:hypothetical protein